MTANIPSATSLLFPTWRELWAPLPGMQILLRRAEAALQRRSAGNQTIPSRNPSGEDDNFALSLCALRAWADDEPPVDSTRRPKIIRSIFGHLRAALLSSFWPRWILLERALDDALHTGDLLFGALILRTMCEEIQHLHILDLDDEELGMLAASNIATEQERLQIVLKLTCKFLAISPHNNLLEREEPLPRALRKALPVVEAARVSLNTYVHPNYGTHVASLFPEHIAAARTLLKAIAAVYEGFFALSWAEQPVHGASVPSGVSPLEP